MAAALSTLALIGVSSPARALSGSPQTGPFPVGNLLSYANSDMEGTAGDWISVSNAALSLSTSTALLHDDSLADTSASAGTSAYKLDANNYDQINLTGGDTYTVGAYFKIPATSGESLTFGLGNYDSSGTWLGWSYTSSLSLNNSGKWQYVQGQITEPSTRRTRLAPPRSPSPA